MTKIDTEAPAADDTAAADEAAQVEDAVELSPFEQRIAEMSDGLEEGGEDAEEEPDDQDPAASQEGTEEEDGAEATAEEDPEGEEGDGDETTDAEDDASVVTFSLPGRNADGEEFEGKIPREVLEAHGIDPDQFAERLAQTKNGYIRRERLEVERRQVHDEVAADRAELASIEAEITSSPADFVIDRLAPDVQRDVARKVLAQLPDEAFDELLGDVQGWVDDPSTRRLLAANEKEAKVDRRAAATKQGSDTVGREKAVQEIAGAVAALIPETMEDTRADEFFDYAAYKLEQWASKQQKGTRLVAADVPALLEKLGALAPYGLAANGQQQDTRKDPPAPPSKDGKPRADTVGKDLKARDQRRKEAAAVTPAGAGAATAHAAPPKGQTIAQRLDWLAKRK